jgi:hypothetical protein
MSRKRRAFSQEHLTMAALVPGLAVEAKGGFNDKQQLVANQVTFHGGDLKSAQDIQAKLAPTDQQVQQNQQQIKADQQKLQQKSFKRRRQRPPQIKRPLQLLINALENWATTIF